MEITEELVNKISHMPIDYIHVSMMDTHATTREGKYAGQERSTPTFSTASKASSAVKIEPIPISGIRPFIHL
jgi:hypothetical protein